MSQTDKEFFERADEHISLSNQQLSKSTLGKVSASMLYSTARFNAFVSACQFKNVNEMKSAKEETIKYFVAEYEKMLTENFDDYQENFSEYIGKFDN